MTVSCVLVDPCITAASSWSHPALLPWRDSTQRWLNERLVKCVNAVLACSAMRPAVAKRALLARTATALTRHSASSVLQAGTNPGWRRLSALIALPVHINPDSLQAPARRANRDNTALCVQQRAPRARVGALETRVRRRRHPRTVPVHCCQYRPSTTCHRGPNY